MWDFSERVIVIVIVSLIRTDGKMGTPLLLAQRLSTCWRCWWICPPTPASQSAYELSSCLCNLRLHLELLSFGCSARPCRFPDGDLAVCGEAKKPSWCRTSSIPPSSLRLLGTSLRVEPVVRRALFGWHDRSAGSWFNITRILWQVIFWRISTTERVFASTPMPLHPKGGGMSQANGWTTVGSSSHLERPKSGPSRITERSCTTGSHSRRGSRGALSAQGYQTCSTGSPITVSDNALDFTTKLLLIKVAACYETFGSFVSRLCQQSDAKVRARALFRLQQTLLFVTQALPFFQVAMTRFCLRFGATGLWSSLFLLLLRVGLKHVAFPGSAL